MKRHETDPLRLDRETAEQLLTGRLGSASVPPGYEEVAAIIAAAAAPAQQRELRGARTASMHLASEAVSGRSAPTRRRVALRTKIAVLGLAGALVVTGGLSAAGALPDAAQQVAHDVLQTVGIHVPGPNAHAGTHPFERGKSGKTKDHVPGKPSSPAAKPPKPTAGPETHGKPSAPRGASR